MEIEGWTNLRGPVISRKISMSETLAKMFSLEALERIKVDLKYAWIEDKYNKVRQKAFLTIDTIMDEKKKFIRATDFEGDPRLVMVVDFQKVKADTIGYKFPDKWGNVYRMKFVDVDVVDGKYVPGTEGQVFDNASYGFGRDFKNAGVNNGDVCLLLTFTLGHPLNQEITYRKWIFQPVMPKPEAVASSTPTAPVTNEGSDNQIDLSSDPGDGNGGDSESTTGF